MTDNEMDVILNETVPAEFKVESGHLPGENEEIPLTSLLHVPT
jgi:hypothetical protein